MPSIKAHVPAGVSEMAVTAIQHAQIGSDSAGMYPGLLQCNAGVQGCLLKSSPFFILTLHGEDRAAFAWQKGTEEEIVGAVFTAVNCQCGIKDQLDS